MRNIRYSQRGRKATETAAAMFAIYNFYIMKTLFHFKSMLFSNIYLINSYANYVETTKTFSLY